MKKSVIVLIAIIYAASITMVTFFGLKYSNYFAEKIPVTGIEIVGEGIKIDDTDGSKYIALEPDADGNRTYQVEYKVYPDNAQNAEVEFVMDSPFATVNENGLVTFTKPGFHSATLYVSSTDGPRVTDSIVILFLR